MGNFEEGVRELERQRALRALEPAPALSDAIDAHALAGAPYRPGERVRDLKTGEEGHVIAVAYYVQIVPPAGRAGD